MGLHIQHKMSQNKNKIKNLTTIDYFLNRPLQAIYWLVSEALEAFAYVSKAELFLDTATSALHSWNTSNKEYTIKMSLLHPLIVSWSFLILDCSWLSDRWVLQWSLRITDHQTSSLKATLLKQSFWWTTTFWFQILKSDTKIFDSVKSRYIF